MSLAPSVAIPQSRFSPLHFYIGLFCLLWSFAFVAGKIGVTDCPPLILLTARFSLAGILILQIRHEAPDQRDGAQRNRPHQHERRAPAEELSEEGGNRVAQQHRQGEAHHHPGHGPAR